MRKLATGAIAVCALMACAPPALAWEHSWTHASSSDGRYVVVSSMARLTPQDTDDANDLYVWSNGTHRLVTTGPRDSTGWQNELHGRFISDDGSRVIFETPAALALNDLDSGVDVYERVGDRTSLLSTGPTDPQALTPIGEREWGIHEACHSADGRYVYFTTLAKMNTRDRDETRDVYLRHNGETTLVSTDASNRNTPGTFYAAHCSADGRRVILHTDDKLVPDDTDGAGWDFYAKEGAQTELITKGTQAGFPDEAQIRDVSPDARSVTFDTSSALVAQDTDTQRDVYQNRNGTIRLVSADEQGASGACSQEVVDYWTGIGYPGYACYARGDAQSANGTHVAVSTSAALVAADTNGVDDLYDVGPQGPVLLTPHTESVQETGSATYSADGGRVVFESRFPLGVDADDGHSDVFERHQGVTRAISAAAVPGATSKSVSYLGASTDARRVVMSTTGRLVAEDTDDDADLYEAFDGSLTLLTPGDGNANYEFNRHSADASTVFFSTKQRMTPNDTDDSEDAYMSRGGAMTLLSG